MNRAPILTKRIESIDILRGIVMIVMALDHVRDYFHIGANTDDPLNLETTYPALFFTRWITHFCAPIFVFLSGVSIYLQSLKKSKKELSVFLITRGLWLILIEVLVVSFGWTFNPGYRYFILQVIWAIGISMFILGLLIHLRFSIILAFGLLIVLGHNLLDILESGKDFTSNVFLDFVHAGFFVTYPLSAQHSILHIYPFLPWLGLMVLGYCTGVFFNKEVASETRKNRFLTLGLLLVSSFVVLRYLNVYGDPVKWTFQNSNMLTFFSFLKLNKYPPSLLFMCLTIGVAFIALAFLENIKNGLFRQLAVFGRVAFFYYILHIYVIHFLSLVAFFLRGHEFSEATNTATHHPFYFVVPGEGYNLALVYLIWVLVIISLYPLCKWYNAYKTLHKEKWWLSYL